MLQNLHKSTYTYLAPSKEVPGEIGVFAAIEIPAKVDPFEVCNADPRGIIWVTEAEITDLPTHVGERIKRFIIAATDGRYPLPITGLNGIDSSFYCNSSAKSANCAYFEEEDDSRGLSVIKTTKEILRGEEILLSYPLTITPRCCVCDERCIRIKTSRNASTETLTSSVRSAA